jgi:predicted ester cyclase
MEEKSSMEMSKLSEFGERYAKAWCSQDPASVSRFYSESGSLAVNDGSPAVGRESIARVAQGFMSDFPDMRVTMDNLVLTANGTEFHWTLAGTNTGPGGTGKRVRISGYEVWRMSDDGLIAESQGHFDSADYEHQLRHGVES